MESLESQDWDVILAQAPGKLIISGEYSVVYGKRAIAATIGLLTSARVEKSNEQYIILELDSWNWSIKWPVSLLEEHKIHNGEQDKQFYFDETLVGFLETRILNGIIEESSIKSKSGDDQDQSKIKDAALTFLMIYMGIGDYFANSKRLPLKVRVSSDIAVGAGLGSSSAYGVSLINAISCAYNKILDIDQLCHWSFQIDRYFHGKPSGIDNNVISRGGYILFQAGKVTSPKLDIPPCKVLIIDSRVSRSTKTSGKKIMEELATNSNRIDGIFKQIDAITGEIWLAMNRADFRVDEITSHLDDNHKLLEELGVGHDELAHIHQLARECDLVAKITGAGCGGNAFVLYNDNQANQIAKLSEMLDKNGYGYINETIGQSRSMIRVRKGDVESMIELKPKG